MPRLCSLLLLSVCALAACDEASLPRAAFPDGGAPAALPADAAPRVATPLPAPVDAGAADGPRRSLSGRLSDLVGEAVAGATVRAGGGSATSGPDGSYSLLALQSASDVRVEAPGYRARRLRQAAGETPARQDVLLIAVGTVGGTVTDPAGLPVRGAAVRLVGSGVWPPRDTTSDAFGRYAFDDVAEGVYELWAALRGPAAALVSEVLVGVEVLGPGGAATADLPLLRAGAVVGRVATVDGRPVVSARLSLSDDLLSLSSEDTTTGPGGAYRTSPLPPGRYFLRVEAPDAPAFGPVEVLVGTAETTFHVTLPTGAVVRGKVVDAAGQPVAGARVAVRVEGGDGPRTLSARMRSGRERVAALRSHLHDDLGTATGASRPAVALPELGQAATDAQGRFSLLGVPQGRVTVLAVHPGHGPGAAPPLELADGDTREVVVSLTTPATLVGRVVDELGNAMDGARVLLYDPRGLSERRVLRAGEGGRFRVTGLAVGEVRVAASEPGHLSQQRVVTLRASEDTEVELRLVRGNTVIEGLCTDAEGTPVAGARLTLSSTNPPMEPRVGQSDAVGHFRFESLPEGTYTVRAEADGQVPLTLAGVDGSDALELQFSAGASLDGRVVDESGAPVAGAAVELRRAAHPPRLTRADPEGRFRFAALAAATYRLGAHADGHEDAPTQDVEVSAGESAERAITLRRREP